MIGARIAAYLEQEGSFREGLQLLKEAGGPYASFEAVAKSGWVSEEDKARLNEALQVFAQADIKKLSLSDPRVAVAHSTEPNAVAETRSRVRQLKKRESFLHAQLVTTSQQPESEERKEQLHDLAGQILGLEFEIDGLWDQIREYEQSGTLPVAGADRIRRETVEMMKERDSLRSQIYKLKKKIAKAEGAQQIKLKSDLADKQQALASLEDVLGL